MDWVNWTRLGDRKQRKERPVTTTASDSKTMTVIIGPQQWNLIFLNGWARILRRLLEMFPLNICRSSVPKALLPHHGKSGPCECVRGEQRHLLHRCLGGRECEEISHFFPSAAVTLRCNMFCMIHDNISSRNKGATHRWCNWSGRRCIILCVSQIQTWLHRAHMLSPCSPHYHCRSAGAAESCSHVLWNDATLG